MPYKDKEKQREAVRKAVKKHRNTQDVIPLSYPEAGESCNTMTIPDVIPETVNLPPGEILGASDAPESTLEALKLLKGGLRTGMSGLLPLDKKRQAGKARM